MERKKSSWLLNAVILTAFIALGGYLGHSVLVIGSVLFNGSQYQVLPDQSILRLDFISTPLVRKHALLERLDGRTGKVLARRKIVASSNANLNPNGTKWFPRLISETNSFREVAITSHLSRWEETNTATVQIIDTLSLQEKRTIYLSPFYGRVMWDQASGELITPPSEIQFDSNISLVKSQSPWLQFDTATIDHGEIFFVLSQPGSSTDEVFRLEGNKAVTIMRLPLTLIEDFPGFIDRSWRLTYDGQQFLVAFGRDNNLDRQNAAYFIDVSKREITWESPTLFRDISVRPIGHGRFYIGNPLNEEIVDHQGTSIAKLDRGLRDGWVTLFTSDVKTLNFPRRLGGIQLVDAKSLEVIGRFPIHRSYIQLLTLCASLLLWAGLLTVFGMRLFQWRPEISFLGWAWVLWIFQWAVRDCLYFQFPLISDGISQSIILAIIVYWSWLCLWVIRGQAEFIGRASCVVSLLVVHSAFCHSAYFSIIEAESGRNQAIVLILLFLSLWMADRAFTRWRTPSETIKRNASWKLQFGVRELILFMTAASLAAGVLPWGKPGFFDLNFISRIPRAILGPIFSLLAMLYLSRFFWDYSLSRRWLSACIALTLLVAIDFAIAWYAEYPASFERRMQTTVMHIPQVIAFGLVVPRLGTCNTMRRTSDSQLTAEA